MIVSLNKNKNNYLPLNIFIIDKALLIIYLHNLALFEYLLLFFLYSKNLNDFIIKKLYLFINFIFFLKSKKANLNYLKKSKNQKLLSFELKFEINKIYLFLS